jgi:SAM-dependent methyltransferase
MPFYDYYGELQATAVGRGWVVRQARNLLAHLVAARPGGGKLLEVGPGRGVFADVCAAAGLEYTALDINRRLLAAVALRGHNGLLAQAPRLAVADAAFDIAFAAHVIEHSPTYPDALGLVAEMRRVVAPGGVVALVAPDYLALREDFWNCDYSHSFVTTRRRLRQIMRDGGLEPVTERYLWGPLEGLAGRLGGPLLGGSLVGRAGRVLPGRFGERVYKLRLTFARASLVVGRVPR